ncbi:MAG: glycoside hydrolase family 99-like domain-containing protein [Verrucomicrobiia bacterium]|jgi:hypothetical protein
MKTLAIHLLASTIALTAALPSAGAADSKSASATIRRSPEIAAIYFPGFHRDDHYDSWFGEGWNEWKLVMNAKPRFHGQRFFLPEWGPFDEADPKWMEKQIALAADHGIGVFVFDWYWYSGVKILHRPLEEGFLKARNRQKLKYALMWANHDWRNCFPAPLDNKQTLWLPSRVTPADFERVMAHCIALHFRQPNYWRVDDGLYFSVFRADTFVQQLGGTEKARAVVDRARQQIAAAGLGRLHLAAFSHSSAGATDLRAAGFDSLTTYSLGVGRKAKPSDQPIVNYADLVEEHEKLWKEMDSGVLPYAPIVSVGWDTSSRWAKGCPWPPPNIGYPYTSVVVGNTPELFGEVCRRARRHCESSRLRPPAVLVNAWNEWTEGSALLPDREYKTRFLEELNRAFAPAR